jgi:hypothetical protein
MEHSVVNKYSDMIAEEVNRYKNEMLNYFHAQQIDANKVDNHDSTHRYYTTSLVGTTYELEGYMSNELFFTQQMNVGNDDEESRISSTMKSSSDDHSHSKSSSYEKDQSQTQTFLTEDPISTNETNTVPFYEAFRIPPNLVNPLMFE